MSQIALEAPKYNRLTSAERSAALIEAGLACLARGGILEFTFDNICKEAGVSRGLITHHFGSKDGLLVAIYRSMYVEMLEVIETPPSGRPRLLVVLDAMFAPEFFSREGLNVWVALWGEIVNNPALRKEHRRLYARYRRGVELALSEMVSARGLSVDVKPLATMLISLVDGLGLERCIEPKLLSPRKARRICFSTLEQILGPLE
jgi:TetR/AcrR family transcriptional regulator, transcriptional repressor of bet genes